MQWISGSGGYMISKPHNLSFALANTAAVLAALFIAFALDLERPYWAMFTVFIIAKPISGSVRSKAAYRFVGTAGGAAMALFLVPPLVQAPVLLCLALSGWVGICLYFSLLDRTPRSYCFMLAGYTAAIVGFSVVGRPEAIFDTMVARLEEISLGIVCGATAHSIFFPQNIATRLNERIERTINESAVWIANALTRPHQREDARAHQQLAQVVTDLHVLYTHVAFETSEIPRAGRIMRALQDRLAVLAASLSSVQEALTALRAEAPLRPPLIRFIRSASRWARVFADSSHGIEEQEQLPPLRLASPDDVSDRQSLLEQASAAGLDTLLKALRESRALASALKDPSTRLSSDLQREVDSCSRGMLHSDRGLALLSACVATGACLVACALWIQLSWPEGGVAAQFAAIGCCLGATLDKPSRFISGAILGILMALPLGAIYVFAIFPGIDGFPSLALVLAPVLLLFSFMQTSEKLEGAALVLAIAFSGALALQPSYQADFASFFNANAAEIVGLLLANATIVIFRTIDPRWNAIRISCAGWRAVSRLAIGERTDIEDWTLSMFDRMGLVMSRLRDEDLPQAVARHIDPLRDLRVGLNLVALKRAGREFPTGIQTVVGRVLTDVSDTYDRYASGRHSMNSELLTSIDTGIRLLTAQPPSADRRAGLTALTLLGLDLAPTPVTAPNMSEAVAP
ncbi:FUSC family protein [Paraburkholderia sp. JPY418]|nr:FUSC family protein [Paraburkholderia youngii]